MIISVFDKIIESINHPDALFATVSDKSNYQYQDDPVIGLVQQNCDGLRGGD